MKNQSVGKVRVAQLPNRGGDIVEGGLSSNSRVSQTAGYVAINDKSPDRCSQGF